MADTAVTISDDRISRLSQQEIAATGCNFKAKVLYTDVAFGSGSTDTVTMTVGSTPAKFLVDKAFANVTTAFAGTGAFTFKAGATDDDAFIADTSVMTAGVINLAGSVPAAAAGSKGTAAQTIKFIFTNATSGAPEDLSAGEMDVYLNILDTASLP